MNHSGTVELVSERLILRRFRESDAEQIFSSFLNDEGFLYYANKEPKTLEQEKEALKGIGERYNSKEYYNWLITLKDGTVIGAVNLRVDNAGDSLEFNYAVDSRHRNHGYMTEALNLVKDYAVNTLKARRFCGGCAVSNTASRRVMEKCGLTYERTLASHLELKDGPHDMMVYSYVSSKGNTEETLSCR